MVTATPIARLVPLYPLPAHPIAVAASYGDAKIRATVPSSEGAALIVGCFLDALFGVVVGVAIAESR